MKEIIHKAIKEIAAKQEINPFNPREIVFDGVAVELSEFEGQMLIMSIRSWKHGKASGVMHEILDVADKYGITTQLTVDPFGNKGLKKRQLAEWYKRLGFVKEKGMIDSMIRYPKVKEQIMITRFTDFRGLK